MLSGMVIGGLLAAAVLCFGITLSSFITTLYIEALRLRPHAGARAFAYCDEHVLPKLGLEEREGARRYAMVRQVSTILLTVDIAALSAPAGPTLALGVEVVVLAVAAFAVFGQIIPAVLVSRTNGKWAAGFLWPARIMAWTIHPLVLLTGFASSVAELGSEQPAEDNKSNKSNNGAESIEVLLAAGEEEGLIDDEDRKLIQSVVEFGDKTVREVMTPRPEIVAIEAGGSVEELCALQLEEGYSRIPVYEASIDNIIGFVHSRDTLEVAESERAGKTVRELLRPIASTPETKPIQELMRELQQASAQMAVVIDEYGQTAGLATMEDLMEEIVGEIRDESEPELDVEEMPDHSFVSSGNLDLDRLDELVGFRPDEEIESTTIGGLVCEELGEVPEPGAKVRLDGIEIEVLSADERRVRSVRVRRVETPPEGPPTADEEARQ